MNKLKNYLANSLFFVLFLLSCKEEIKNKKETGIFTNGKDFILVKEDSLLYPQYSGENLLFENGSVFFNNNKYEKIKTDNNYKFDSIEVSFNTKNYEIKGIKEFDAKIYSDKILFYDVENNRTHQAFLNDEFKEWLSYSSQKIKTQVDNENSNYITCIIINKNNQTKTIYNNSINDINTRLFMIVLSNFLSNNRSESLKKSKVFFRSEDSLNAFVIKNNIGILRVPMPTK